MTGYYVTPIDPRPHLLSVEQRMEQIRSDKTRANPLDYSFIFIVHRSRYWEHVLRELLVGLLGRYGWG